MKRILLAVMTMANIEAASAAEIEHWTCTNGHHKITWTLAENRMFTAKGKGALSLLSNSPSSAIAYDLHRSTSGQPISTVFVLDKVTHKLIEYNDANAVIFNGRDGIPFDPDVTISLCEPSN